MTQASLDAYISIIPDLPRREQEVMAVLYRSAQAAGCQPGSIKRGPHGMTNRQIAAALGLERDSVSPRIGALKNKGRVVAAGISGKETLWEIALDPRPPRKKLKASKAVLAVIRKIRAHIEAGGAHPELTAAVILCGELVD